MSYYPLPFTVISAYYLITNLIHFKVFWTLFWSLPFFLSINMRKNLTENAQSVVKEFYLYNNGTMVRMIAVSGKPKDIKIHNLIKP